MGADYRYSREYGLYFPSGTTVVAANTQRHYTYSVHIAAMNQVMVPMPHDAIISRLRNYAVLAPGVGETFTYTLVVNAAPTALTAQTAGAVDLVSEDLVNLVAVVRGDLIQMRIDTSLNAVGTRHANSLMVRRI